MDIKEYDRIYSVEDDNWWYTGLRKLVLSFMERHADGQSSLTVLDAGCGTGGMLAQCKAYKAFGLDSSEEALSFCRLRGLKDLSKGSVCDMPFKDNSFDMIISLDVLYHLNVSDDLKAMKEFYRVMARNGILLLNLPAYNFLKSSHDKIIHTRHRYTLRDLKNKAESAGFTVERITYRNTLLFPLAAAIRLIKKSRRYDDKKRGSDLKALPGPVNKFLEGLLGLENRLISSGLNFPFGLSIFCVAKKR